MSTKIEKCVYLELSFGEKWYSFAKHPLGKILSKLCLARSALPSTNNGHIQHILSNDWDHRYNIPPHMFFNEENVGYNEECGCIRCQLETQDFTETDCFVLFVNAHLVDDDTILSADGLPIPVHSIVHALNCCPTLAGKTKLILVRRLSEALSRSAGTYLCSYCAKPLREFCNDFVCRCGKCVCNNCVQKHLQRNPRVVHELEPINQASAKQLEGNGKEVNGLPDDTVLLKSRFGCSKIEFVLWDYVKEYRTWAQNRALPIMDLLKALPENNVHVTIQQSLQKNVEF